jgi:polyhydroxyalkanoate synthesis regulator phasin
VNKIYKEYLQNGVIDEDNAVDIIEEQQKEIENLNKMLEEKFMKENPFIVENGIICKKNKEIERLNKEIERLNEIIEDLHKKLCDIQDFIEYEIKQLDDDKFLLRVLDLEEMLDIIKRS